MKELLLFVLAVCMAAWSGPAQARQCAREEQNDARQLERAIARCAGDPDCERAARDECFYHPSGTPGDGHYSVGQFTSFLTHTP